MEDKIFGTMNFKVGWTKYETLKIWDKVYNVCIRTSSLKDQLPTEKQQNAYMSFKENFSFICEQSKDLINNFVESNKGIIYEQLGVETINDVSTLLTPYEVLFFQNGKYAIIFATKWSEEEMCILCDGNNIKVDEGYILRYEI
jgi:hypothetical protein